MFDMEMLSDALNMPRRVLPSPSCKIVIPPVSSRKTKSAPFDRLGPDRITDELRALVQSPSHCPSYVYLGK